MMITFLTSGIITFAFLTLFDGDETLSFLRFYLFMN